MLQDLIINNLTNIINKLLTLINDLNAEEILNNNIEPKN